MAASATGGNDWISRGGTAFSLPVHRWVFYDSAAKDKPALDLSFVEPLLRRRLSSLAKMTLFAARGCCACPEETKRARFVYASRHGELSRTTAMLESLAAGEPLSPTAFSLSVLNASAGLFSMIFGNTAPTTAISAGRSSFGYGLLEAALQWAKDPSQPVLYLFSDEPPPAIYGVEAAETAHALGLLLKEPAATWLHCSQSREDSAASDGVQSRAFARCLSEARSSWSDGKSTWRWETRARAVKSGAAEA